MRLSFYSASALLAVQTAVLARPFLSVCLSVRPSRSSIVCVQTKEDTIVWFSASGRTIFLVCEEVNKLVKQNEEELSKDYSDM